MKKVGLAFIVILLLSGLGFWGYKLKTFHNDRDFLVNYFPNGYSSKAVKVGESLVVYADSYTDFYEEDPVVYQISGGQIKSVFKISIGDFNVYNDKFMATDDLLISEWIGSADGSDGLRGLVLWKVIDGKLQPVGGYSDDDEVFSSDSKISVISEKEQNQQFSFPLGGMNAYSEYKFSDPLELRYAFMIWKPEESHGGSHQWQLSSYILKGNGFIRNQNWNNGETYTTKEKIEGWGSDDDLKQFMGEEFDKH